MICELGRRTVCNQQPSFAALTPECRCTDYVQCTTGGLASGHWSRARERVSTSLRLPLMRSAQPSSMLSWTSCASSWQPGTIPAVTAAQACWLPQLFTLGRKRQPCDMPVGRQLLRLLTCVSEGWRNWPDGNDRTDPLLTSRAKAKCGD